MNLRCNYLITGNYNFTISATPIGEVPQSSRPQSCSSGNNQANRIAIATKNRIAVASFMNVYLIDFFVKGYPLKLFCGHKENVTDMIFIGDTFFSCGEDGNWCQWNVDQPTTAAICTGKNNSPLNTISCTPDGKYVMTGDDAGYLKLWNVASQTVISSIHISKRPIRSIAFSDQRQMLVAGLHDGGIVIAQIADHCLIEQSRISTHIGPILRILFSPDQKIFTSTSADSTAKLWDAETCALKSTLSDPSMKKWIWDCCYSKDSTKVYTCGTDCVCREWNESDGMLIRQFQPQKRGITCMAMLETDIDQQKPKDVDVVDLK